MRRTTESPAQLLCSREACLLRWWILKYMMAKRSCSKLVFLRLIVPALLPPLYLSKGCSCVHAWACLHTVTKRKSFSRKNLHGKLKVWRTAALQMISTALSKFVQKAEGEGAGPQPLTWLVSSTINLVSGHTIHFIRKSGEKNSPFCFFWCLAKCVFCKNSLLWCHKWCYGSPWLLKTPSACWANSQWAVKSIFFVQEAGNRRLKWAVVWNILE